MNKYAVAMIAILTFAGYAKADEEVVFDHTFATTNTQTAVVAKLRIVRSNRTVWIDDSGDWHYKVYAVDASNDEVALYDKRSATWSPVGSGVKIVVNYTVLDAYVTAAAGANHAAKLKNAMLAYAKDVLEP